MDLRDAAGSAELAPGALLADMTPARAEPERAVVWAALNTPRDNMVSVWGVREGEETRAGVGR